MGITRIYQRNAEFHKITLTIPASVTDWIDTGLDPRVVGTRPLGCTWYARVAYSSKDETADSFRQRMSDVKVRYAPEPSMSGNRKCYVYLTGESTDTPVSPPMDEVRLSATEGTWLRFPMEPGRIEVRLAGARPTDEGNVRFEFGVRVAAPDDFVAADESTFDDVEICTTGEVVDFSPPPLPDPGTPKKMKTMEPSPRQKKHWWTWSGECQLLGQGDTPRIWSGSIDGVPPDEVVLPQEEGPRACSQSDIEEFKRNKDIQGLVNSFPASDENAHREAEAALWELGYLSGLQLSAVILRKGTEPLTDAAHYCLQVIGASKYAGSLVQVGQWCVLGVNGPVDATEAIIIYTQQVKQGHIVDLGNAHDIESGKGPDGEPIVVLYSIRVGARETGKIVLLMESDEDGVVILDGASIPGFVGQGATNEEANRSFGEAKLLCLRARALYGLPLTVQPNAIGTIVTPSVSRLTDHEVIDLFGRHGWKVALRGLNQTVLVKQGCLGSLSVPKGRVAKGTLRCLLRAADLTLGQLLSPLTSSIAAPPGGDEGHADAILKRLAVTYKKLVGTLSDNNRKLEDPVRAYDGTRRPGRAEMAPILQSVQSIADILGEFLKSLHDLVNNAAAIEAARGTLAHSRLMAVVDAPGLLAFYHAAGSINRSMEENEIAPSDTWMQTMDLCAEFAYLGSTGYASSSLMSVMPALTQLFDEANNPTEWHACLEFMREYLGTSDDIVRKLYDVSQRARALVDTLDK